MSVIQSLQLLVLDVDGVLTDGSIYVDDNGKETKRFHVRDGLGMKLAQSAGLKIGVLTARSRRAVTLRMLELGIDLLVQGSSDKAVGLKKICKIAGVSAGQTAYLGDDLVDIPALKTCGYPMAVADAVDEVKAIAKFTTTKLGGHAAVREAIEHILKTQNRWQKVVDKFSHPIT